MKAFAQFVITACIGLLSWWQLELYIGLGIVTILMLAAGAAVAMLTWKSFRAGYGLAVVIGLAYVTEMYLLAPTGDLFLLQPLLAWALGLVGCGGWLLWTTREKGPKRPLYERHPEY